MDLSNINTLEARFTNMERTDNAGMRHTMDNAGYTLMKSESGYRDNQNFINAEFHRVGDDYTGAVAGRLDDAFHTPDGGLRGDT